MHSNAMNRGTVHSRGHLNVDMLFFNIFKKYYIYSKCKGFNKCKSWEFPFNNYLHSLSNLELEEFCHFSF